MDDSITGGTHQEPHAHLNVEFTERNFFFNIVFISFVQLLRDQENFLIN